MRDLSLSISATNLPKRKSKVSVYHLNWAILASTILLGFVYLFVINSLGTKGYEIKKLEGQVRELENQQKALQLQASDLQSLNRLQTQASKLNYVPVDKVTYLKDSDFALK